jgi:hypothetical protein
VDDVDLKTKLEALFAVESQTAPPVVYNLA